jgi:predicted GIY-YIG superfamily endonuclease
LALAANAAKAKKMPRRSSERSRASFSTPFQLRPGKPGFVLNNALASQATKSCHDPPTGQKPDLSRRSPQGEAGRPGKPTPLVHFPTQSRPRHHERWHPMHTFHYVYVLVSESNSARHYTGITKNLDKRLLSHNTGKVAHSSRFRPWRIETAIAFRSREKARIFEVFLKSHSGRVFARKHL